MNTSSDTAPVLVTGAAGYVGMHTVTQLLAAGYRVRAAVRSDRRGREVLDTLTAAGLDISALEFAVVDLTDDAGWPMALRGVAHVLHIASPFPAAAPQDDDEVIVPARDGTLRVLRHARDAGCTNVVATSSFAAVGYSGTTNGEWTEDDWTDPADENTAYIRSKAIAERAAWDFIAGEGAGLQLTTLVPVGIFGPPIGSHLSTSVGLIRSMLAGQPERLPPQYFGVVDVRDVATAHIQAMTNTAAAGERILLVADGGPLSFLGIAHILRDGMGDLGRNVATVELTEDQVRTLAQTEPALREVLNRLGQRPQISNGKAKAILGWVPRPVSDTILDTARALSVAAPE